MTMKAELPAKQSAKRCKLSKMLVICPLKTHWRTLLFGVLACNLADAAFYKLAGKVGANNGDPKKQTGSQDSSSAGLGKRRGEDLPGPSPKRRRKNPDHDVDFDEFDHIWDASGQGCECGFGNGVDGKTLSIGVTVEGIKENWYGKLVGGSDDNWEVQLYEFSNVEASGSKRSNIPVRSPKPLMRNVPNSDLRRTCACIYGEPGAKAKFTFFIPGRGPNKIMMIEGNWTDVFPSRSAKSIMYKPFDTLKNPTRMSELREKIGTQMPENTQTKGIPCQINRAENMSMWEPEEGWIRTVYKNYLKVELGDGRFETFWPVDVRVRQDSPAELFEELKKYYHGDGQLKLGADGSVTIDKDARPPEIELTLPPEGNKI